MWTRKKRTPTGKTQSDKNAARGDVVGRFRIGVTALSLKTGQRRLNNGLKALLDKWQRARMYWSDDVSDRFEATHLRTIAIDVRSAVGAMGEMAKILDQVREECE